MSQHQQPARETPLACSEAHIAGSQATIALGLTCPAIHRAADVLAAVAACSEPDIGGRRRSRDSGAAGERRCTEGDRRHGGRDPEHGAAEEREQCQPVTLRRDTGVAPPTTGPWSR